MWLSKPEFLHRSGQRCFSRATLFYSSTTHNKCTNIGPHAIHIHVPLIKCKFFVFPFILNLYRIRVFPPRRPPDELIIRDSVKIRGSILKSQPVKRSSPKLNIVL
ncbi:unnamed protein product [Cuscuta epithymum]|uniref:Uncharacterized protein n=1 Tax=Cuscuta epithymum TaxID=186058 RepID=A0AAV0DE43_9ASTE|nr:unnamed protein product [Cuscuta epithymum]